jgi:peptidoglycan/xylan/chitin deacetylase (PgdA/CDA1 family)
MYRRAVPVSRRFLAVGLLVLGAIALAAAAFMAGASDDADAAQGLANRETIPMLGRDGFAGTVPYTIQPGDTLYSIARRFGTSIEALAALNGIGDASQIRAGDHIFIPSAAPPAGPSTLVSHGNRGSTMVALTFDMGGRVDPALDIMNWLIANGIRATIFPTGAMAENLNTDAGREVLRLVDTHRDLFELGNHSYSHPDFTTLSDAAIREELVRTEAAVAGQTSLNMRPRFRPPYGAYDNRVLAAVGAAGYSQTVLWDVDTIDWLAPGEGGPTAAQIASKVVTMAEGGSIVLMHLGGWNTLEALPAIVAGLREHGLHMVALSEMLGR